MAAQRGARRARTNPLIPVEPAPAEVAPSVSEAPICGQCWPGGWASLPEGADYASCEHGEWSTRESLLDRAMSRPHAARSNMASDWPHVIDGVTLDGTPVTVTIRPGEPALISLSDVQLGSVAISPSPLPEIDPAHPWAPTGAPVSPFKPKPAPAPMEVEPGELDTGDDVMFMPSGG